MPVASEGESSVNRAGSKKRNNSDNCYVNIKPFVHPLPPVPKAEIAVIDSGQLLCQFLRFDLNYGHHI